MVSFVPLVALFLLVCYEFSSNKSNLVLKLEVFVNLLVKTCPKIRSNSWKKRE